MTNNEKYKDIEERTKKFLEFCNAQSCCPRCLLHDKYSRGVECAYAWEELEYEEELLPCPFCGGEAELINSVESWVECSECHSRTGMSACGSGAIEKWNRRN